MTEITRVPLQPIARGALSKLWLGLAACLLVAAGVAWATLPSFVKVEAVSEGKGRQPGAGDVAIINYVGRLADGKEFDRGREVPMPLAGVVPGFREGLSQMKSGGKYKLTIPASKAYGAREQRNPATGEVVIPANSDLVFDVDLLGIMSEGEFQQRMQMQQMMQMQRGGRGPGGPEGEAPPAHTAPSRP